tara:strand:+ start:414 stop:2900 length:2487 start_codon:yes stop_codon:yes gene_type:complete
MAKESQKTHIDKIIDFLGLDQEGFDLSSYKEELKQKTLKGTLTIKDALFITLNEKGLKILKKSFVEDPDAKMLSEIFPLNKKIDIPGGQTLAVSPEPSSAISNWSNLVSKINTKTGQDEKEILNTPIQNYIREGVSEEFDMKGKGGGASALRQGIFYARKQLGFSPEEKQVVRNTYLDDPTLKQELGGSKTYGQKRLEGKGIGTRNIRADDATVITQAVKEGMSVITDPDAKAAIMYNTLIPHRTVQVSRLRINPETDAKGNILKDATDPYLDGDKIVVPEEGTKKGQKRYTTIQLTPFMQDFLGQIAANNPDRTYLFRDNNVGEEAFATKINNALQLPGGVAEKTQAFVDAGKFTGPVNTFGMLRKLSALSTVLSVPGSAGNLRYIMGHTNLKQVASETGIDQQQKIHYIGDVQEGRTDLEVMQLYEDELQKNSGASSKRDFLRNTFNITEVELPETFVETPVQAAEQAVKASADFADKESFKATIENDESLSREAKNSIIQQFGSQPDPMELYRADREAVENSYNNYEKSIIDAGGTPIDEDDYYNSVKSERIERVEKPVSPVLSETPQPTQPSVTPTPEVKPKVETPPISTEFKGFTDTSSPESGLVPKDQQQRVFDALKRFGATDEQIDALEKLEFNDLVKRMGPKVIAFLLGGAGALATIGDAVAEVALSPTELGYGGLDPAEQIRGYDRSEIDSDELVSTLQEAASQRRSPDIVDRTTALAEIEGGREALGQRAFSPIARQQAEQSRKEQMQSGLGDFGETTQAEEMRRLFGDIKDVDTSKAFTSESVRERIQSEAAEKFNRGGEEEGTPLTIEINRFAGYQ